MKRSFFPFATAVFIGGGLILADRWNDGRLQVGPYSEYDSNTNSQVLTERGLRFLEERGTPAIEWGEIPNELKDENEEFEQLPFLIRHGFNNELASRFLANSWRAHDRRELSLEELASMVHEGLPLEDAIEFSTVNIQIGERSVRSRGPFNSFAAFDLFDAYELENLSRYKYKTVHIEKFGDVLSLRDSEENSKFMTMSWTVPPDIAVQYNHREPTFVTRVYRAGILPEVANPYDTASPESVIALAQNNTPADFFAGLYRPTEVEELYGINFHPDEIIRLDNAGFPLDEIYTYTSLMNTETPPRMNGSDITDFIELGKSPEKVQKWFDLNEKYGSNLTGTEIADAMKIGITYERMEERVEELFLDGKIIGN